MNWIPWSISTSQTIIPRPKKTLKILSSNIFVTAIVSTPFAFATRPEASIISKNNSLFVRVKTLEA